MIDISKISPKDAQMISGSILVDCCLAADLFLGDDQSQKKAANLRRKFPIWYSPRLVKIELGNVLRNQIRFGRLSKQTALEVLSIATEMLIVCEEPSETVILEEAVATGLTFYDATYVAPAR